MSHKLALGITTAHVLLFGIMLLSVGLHYANGSTPRSLSIPWPS